MSVKLPGVFVESEEFKAITESQRLSLLQRIDNSKQLADSLASGERFNEAKDFVDFAEDLELDASVIQEIAGADHGGLSRWLIHYSWSFNTSPQKMRQCIPYYYIHLLDVQEPSCDSSLEVYRKWFQNIGKNMSEVIDAMSNATTFDASLAFQVILDVLLGRLLISCYKLRLNRFIDR
jgi:hypothetical protein